MSDRIAVMSEGRIAQCGPPEEIYEHPTEEFVAGFIGISNLLEGVVEDGGMVRIATGREDRRRRCRTSATAATRSSSRSGRRRSPSTRTIEEGMVASRARSRARVYLGVSTQITVALGDGARLVALEQATYRASADDRWEPGMKVRLGWHPENCLVLQVTVTPAARRCRRRRASPGSPPADALGARRARGRRPRGPRPGRRPGPLARRSTTAPSSRWAPSSSSPAAPRSWRSPSASGSASGTRACATASASRAGSRWPTERPRRPSTRSTRPLAAGEARRAQRRASCSPRSRSIPARARRSSPAPRSRRRPRPTGPGGRAGAAGPGQRRAGAGDRRRQPAARRGARRRGSGGARSTSATPVRAVALGRRGVVDHAPTTARAGPTAASSPSPRSVIGRIDFEPALRAALAEALAGVRYGHAAKLFVPLRRRRRRPSATLAVPDRYWAWTATGEDDGARSRSSAPSPARRAALAAARRRVDGPRPLARPARGAPARPRHRSGRGVLSTWDDDPWVGAAYSLAAPDPRPTLADRAGGPLAFAGEHLGGEMSALMEGAIRSGRCRRRDPPPLNRRLGHSDHRMRR